MKTLLLAFLLAADVPLETMLSAAESNLQKGKPDRARLMLDEAKKAYPTDGRVDYFYGLAAAQQEKNEEAIGHFRAAIGKAPKMRDAYLQLAMLHDVLGQYELSDGVYKDATKLFDKDAELFAEWGTTLILRKRFKDAEVALKKALALSPKDPTITGDLAFVELKLGKTKDSVQRFEQAFKLGQNDPNVRRQYADALAASGELERAEKVYTELMAKNSGDLDLWYRRSKVREARGDKAGAAADKAEWEKKKAQKP
jgi:Flp pilus assembly protein TadD